MTSATAKHSDLRQLDAVTGGVFTAPTSGERAIRVRTWLSSDPPQDLLQEVFRELSTRDKGAAKALRERLDDMRRARNQEQVASEWAQKAQALLELPKLNIADAMAWQRDAAKAGAPLSKEPLLELKSRLAERVRVIEDLQHRVQVQREAAVLLAQRIEVLSTKPWQTAQGAWDALKTDVQGWQNQAAALLADTDWPSVDLKFPPLLEASRNQLLVVWDAFQNALSQATAASGDPAAPLPPVPVWADELRQARGVAAEPSPKAPQAPRIDPEKRQAAIAAVSEALAKLEAEIAEGHGKASLEAANALRNALKDFGKILSDELENKAHAALAAAGQLEGWQRWRADQLREELVRRAEGLLKRPPGQEIGGRKMQEMLRGLREEWKQTDQGGIPNHAMWKHFDEACNEAHKVVEAWVEKIKVASVEHRAQRLALIAELKTWAEANRTALDDDWRGFARLLREFGERWREAGHMNDKAMAELQPQWKEAMDFAAAPLEALQQRSIDQRQALIAEAQGLGAAPMLRIDAVKALQQRWQAEAQAVPMDRRQEQKLWDAFRKPIDDAFARKTAEREKAEAALGEHDRGVIDAARALDEANASGDAQRIRAALAALEAATRGQAVAAKAVASAKADEAQNAAATPSNAGADAAAAPPASDDTDETHTLANAEAPAAAPEAPKVPVRKPVIAARGDDRPGTRKAEPAPAGRGPARFGDRKDGPRPGMMGAGRDGDGGRGRGGWDRDRPAGGRDASASMGAPSPRLGDAAFRAQRDAVERAQMALRKLASQAHGEALTQLLDAWERRDPTRLPSAQELGGSVNAAARSGWNQALTRPAAQDPTTALLRLEVAAEVPTPAEHHDARRMFQLQLLTRRSEPQPVQTWASDVAQVLAGGFEPAHERRLRNVLKVLLKP